MKPSLTPERAEQIQRLFDEVVELDPDARAVHLDQACPDDPDLRQRVEALLDAFNDRAEGVRHVLEQLPLVPKAPEAAASEAVQDDPHGLTGHMVSHYRIQEKLGSGGMGVVYKAYDTKLDRAVALKFLPSHLSADDEAKARFIQEAKAASALDHPNICTIYDIDETSEGHLFIAMAYYDGETLKKKIHRGPLPLDEALEAAMQMAQGLASAHAGGIVHRDVKPANVMVTQSGRVIIVDFGLAKVAALTGLTKPGSIMGTVAYMSPEQVQGVVVDHRTDLWSLGVVLYEMIAGQRPFSGDYDQAVLYSVLHLDPQSVTGLRPGVPLHLAHLINKALAKSPDQRYQHMNDLLEDLLAIQQRQAARFSAAQEVLPPAPAPEAATTASFSVPGEDSPAKILVVDDEAELELMIQQKFRHEIRDNTWLFSFATGGAEALEMLWADPEIALVLTDLNMPGMDGLTLLGHLADLERPLKAVVVSAYGDIKNIRTAMNRGAFDFLTKPIDLDDLETTIYKTLHELRIYWKAAEAQRQAVAMRQELAVARRIQEANLPLPFPRRSDLDLYAFTTTARDVSGTFYDYFVIGDDRVGFLMGDVAGKGVSAALFTAMSQTFLKRTAQQGEAPGACLTAMNRLLFPEGYADLFVTVFYVRPAQHADRRTGLCQRRAPDALRAQRRRDHRPPRRRGGDPRLANAGTRVLDTADHTPARRGSLPVYAGDY